MESKGSLDYLNDKEKLRKIILLNIFHRKVFCGTNNGSSTASLRKPYFETFIF